MIKRRWPLVLVIVAIAAAVIGGAYLVINWDSISLNDSRIASHKSQLYHCPMHPNYISDKPGTCPICGMTLVPMEEAEPHEMDRMKPEPPGRAPIAVTPTQRQMIGVTTAQVEMKDLTKEIRTVGIVAYDPGLAVAQREYIEALRLGDHSLAKAASERLELMGMSSEQIRQLKRTRRIQKNLYLPASTGKAWIYGTIYASDIPYVKEGQHVVVSMPEKSSTTLEGVIAAIDPIVDQMSRSVRIRSEVADPEGILKPNLYVNVFIRIPLGKTLVVPSSALLWSAKANYVFVDEGKGRLVPREVTVGGQTDDFVQISGGLSEGEKVVSSASFLIDAESQLKATLKSMKGHQHLH